MLKTKKLPCSDDPKISFKNLPLWIWASDGEKPTPWPRLAWNNWISACENSDKNLSEIFVKILIVHETSDFFQVQVISQVESNNIARDDMIFSKRSNAKLYRPVLNDQGFQSSLSQNGFPVDS